MLVTAQTTVYAMVGHPVAQTKSPEYFNRMFDQDGQDAVMIGLDISPEKFPSFLNTFRGAQNIRGLIVTIPHKNDAAQHVDAPSDTVKLLGAANAVRRKKTTEGYILEAEMFDGAGMVRAIESRGGKLRGADALVIGAGAAGGAIAAAFVSAGASHVALTDLIPAKAERLASCLPRLAPGVQMSVGAGEDVSRYSIIVNATPLGMNETDELPLALDSVSPDALVCDVVTKPEITPFLMAARNGGRTVVTGSDMAAGQTKLLWDFMRGGA